MTVYDVGRARRRPRRTPTGPAAASSTGELDRTCPTFVGHLGRPAAGRGRGGAVRDRRRRDDAGAQPGRLPRPQPPRRRCPRARFDDRRLEPGLLRPSARSPSSTTPGRRSPRRRTDGSGSGPDDERRRRPALAQRLPGAAVRAGDLLTVRRLPRMPAAVVILAAGSGSRVGAEVNKVLLPLGDAPVLAWSVRAALAVADVRRVVLVVRPGEERGGGRRRSRRTSATARCSSSTAGRPGTPRSGSALRAARARHRGRRGRRGRDPRRRPPAGRARRCSRPTIAAAREHGGAIPVVPLAAAARPRPATAVRRPTLAGVQTPQAFRAADLLAAYRRADADGFEGTDTAACLERYADLRDRRRPQHPAEPEDHLPRGRGAGGPAVGLRRIVRDVLS